jgi:hypothetical protein
MPASRVSLTPVYDSYRTTIEVIMKKIAPRRATTNPAFRRLDVRFCSPTGRFAAAAVFAAVASGGVLGTAHADVCNEGAIKPGGHGDWSQCQGGAWQYYPPPTFDPHSGDGYGPNQPFPPACIRFKEPCPQ